jgi:hypothetical protein
MSKKRPLAPPASPTDEWGIYDPSKAGMQALYSRLGRPIIRASEASERRARRRGLKSDRPADGVGLAIEEAKRRAGLMSAAHTAPPQTTPEPVAAPPPVVAATPAPPVIEMPAPVKPARATRAKAGKGSKRKPISAAITAAGARLDVGVAAPPAAAPVAADKAAASAAPTIAVPTIAAPTNHVPAIHTPAIDAPAGDGPAGRRAARKTPRSRQAASASAPSTPVVPPPSPRRPRGPVPLAAWAHAVSDTPRPEPKRSEGKGLWRGIFRIPSEVALVEYGRGCRIHRLVIESAPDSLNDPF